MSNNKKKSSSSYSSAVRITCIALAGLTVLGIFATILVYLLG